jgi:hypothetical protein
MTRLPTLILASALLVAPAAVTAAFAQSTAGSQAPATGSAITAPVAGSASSATATPPTKNGPAATGMVRKASPDSPSAQLANPTGAQPGTGSGMGKVSGTAAGN